MSVWKYSERCNSKEKTKEKKFIAQNVCPLIEEPVKRFLFQDFKENILNEIKRRKQVCFIPRCPGLYCLNTKMRFGQQDRNYYVGKNWIVVASALERSTNKLTRLAVKKAFAVETARRIELHQLNGFPINPFLVQVHLELKTLVKAGKDKSLNQVIGIREHTEDQKAVMHIQLNCLVNRRNTKDAVKASLNWHIQKLELILQQKTGINFSKDLICMIKRKRLLHQELREAIEFIHQNQIKQLETTITLKDACVKTIRRGMYAKMHHCLMEKERERRICEISKLKRKKERMLYLQPIHEEFRFLFCKKGMNKLNKEN